MTIYPVSVVTFISEGKQEADCTCLNWSPHILVWSWFEADIRPRIPFPLSEFKEPEAPKDREGQVVSPLLGWSPWCPSTLPDCHLSGAGTGRLVGSPER